MGEGGRVGALSGAERAPLPPPGQKGLLTFRGEGGVSGACEGRWPRGLRGRGLPAPKHPKGRKRRSGWDVGTALTARTRKEAFEERCCGLASLVGGIGFTGGVGRRKALWMVRGNALAACGCLDIIPEWVDIQTRIITC
jgi:hypothetical protein